MFYTNTREEKIRLRNKFIKHGLNEVRMQFGQKEQGNTKSGGLKK